ncbi:MAG: hypothetical protein AB7H97_08470, partial [Pseudobdellovibrionaceae bacterium]
TVFTETPFAQEPNSSTQLHQGRLGDLNKSAVSKSFTLSKSQKIISGSHFRKRMNVRRLGPGEAGGGGTTVTTNGQKELLDIYIFKKTHSNYSNLGSERGVKLPSTRALSYLHLDKLSSRNNMSDLRNIDLLPVQIALQKIESLWGSRPPPFIQSLKQALQFSPIYYMEYRFTRKDGNAWIPPELQIPEASLDVIAYYIKDHGMLVSKKDFEDLDLFNQVAFVIHESLRQMQYTYDMDFWTEDLQIVTANIVFGIPSLPERLIRSDSSKNGQGQSDAVRIFKTSRDSACKVVSKLPQKSFANVRTQICNATLFEMNMSHGEYENCLKILEEALDDAIVLARKLYNEGKISFDPIGQLREYRVEIATASYIWLLYSPEMKQALNTIQEATMGLTHFSFDAAIRAVNDGRPNAYSAHLKSTLESWYRQGALK